MFNDDFFRSFDDMVGRFSRMDRLFREPFDHFDESFSQWDPAYSLPEDGQKKSLRDDFVDQRHNLARLGRRDEDLTGAVERYGLDSIFDSRNGNRRMPNDPNSRSFFKTYQFSRVMNGDKVEERKFETDSSGKRIESYTRRLGDKIYSKTSEADHQGVKEIKEDLINIDEDEKGEFEKAWSSHSYLGPWSQSYVGNSPQFEAIEDKSHHGEEKPKSWRDKLKSIIKL